MREYELEILEQYDIEVTGTRKARGAFFCDTNEGTMLLKETKMSDRRAPFFYEMLWNLKENGGMNVELPVKNKEGSFVSTSKDGNRYMLKRWFVGRHFVQCFSLGSESCTRYRNIKQIVNNENKSLMTFQLV